MDTFEKYGQFVLEELEAVIQKMDAGWVQPALDAIGQADEVIALSGGREALALKFFVMRLMHLGKKVHWAFDDTCPPCKPGTLFICVGGGGGASHVLYVAQQVKKTPAKLLVITANPDSALAQLADLVLCIPAQAYRGVGNVVPTRQTMGNLYEQSEVLVFDIMAMMLRDQLELTDQDMEKRHRNFE